VTYRLLWLDESVPSEWRKHAEWMSPAHWKKLPLAYVSMLSRTLFYPSIVQQSGKRRVTAPGYDFLSFYARVDARSEVHRVGGNVAQFGMTVRRLAPYRVYYTPSPGEPHLEDEDALRAMGARSIVRAHAMVERMKELAAERGVRINPRRRRR